MGVTGASSPASDDEHEMEPPDGDEAHEPRLADHDPEGARPGVRRIAETGVAGASGWYTKRRPDRYHSRTTVDALQ
jgi:hypothetical protein